jgi:virginiamycin B lyase
VSRTLRGALLGAATIALAATSPALAAGPSVTEFPLPTANAKPSAIAASSTDLWFSATAKPGSINRITTAGIFTPWNGGQVAGFQKDKPIAGVAVGADGGTWFTFATGSVLRLDPVGNAATQYTSGLPGSSTPGDIVAGPGTDLWFVDAGADAIGRITSGGSISEFPTGSGTNPSAITQGPDGALWFTEPGTDQIGRITTAGAVQHFPGLRTGAAPADLTTGADGALWFTEPGAPASIGRLDPTDGSVIEYAAGLPAGSQPQGIAAGADGALWFTDAGTNQIGRITTDGTISEHGSGSGLSGASSPTGIAGGPDGRIWFTENADPGRIGVMTVPPAVGAVSTQSVTESSVQVVATVRPNSDPTTYVFEYGPAGDPHASATTVASAGAGAAPVTVTATLPALSASTDHAVRVVATNTAGTASSPDTSFRTADAPVTPTPTPTPADPAPAPPAGFDPPGAVDRPSLGGTPPVIPVATRGRTAPARPSLGRAVVLRAVSGTVLVRRPGTRRSVSLARARAVPVGSLVDATRGTVSLRSAIDRAGHTQEGRFWGGRFVVRQSRRANGMTELSLRGTAPRRCGVAAGVASVTKRRRARAPRLWGRDHHGRFRTEGRNSTATVRGTEWLVEERCDGTLTVVRRGAVSVRDKRTGRAHLVRAGHRHLARRAR